MAEGLVDPGDLITRSAAKSRRRLHKRLPTYTLIPVLNKFTKTNNRELNMVKTNFETQLLIRTLYEMLTSVQNRREDLRMRNFGNWKAPALPVQSLNRVARRCWRWSLDVFLPGYIHDFKTLRPFSIWTNKNDCDKQSRRFYHFRFLLSLKLCLNI